MSQAPEPTRGPRRRTGLRERKKARTRFAIQEQALRLFREQGYGSTTVEQIAEAAEISPSTFFRYFPTKDAVVLTDDYDPLLVESFRRQPADLTVLQAVRAALRETFDGIPDEQIAAAEERHALMVSVPELRAALMDSMVENGRLIASLVAERTGRAADDPEVVALSGAVVGVVLSPFLGSEYPSVRGLLDTVVDGLTHLENGFVLR